jgi:hypothetical protein
VQSFMTGGLANCYCIPTYTGTLCTAGISNVVFNTISNTAACAPPAHAIYPATGSLTTTVEQNGVYNLSVATTDAAIISAWIDYDQNGIIDTTEWAQVATASVANTPSTITLTIPGTALLGNTLMRIRSRVTANNNYGSDACTSFGSGSSQDYIITIAPPSPCSGTPFPGNTIASAGEDGTVQLWNLSGKPIGQPFKGHEKDVKSVAFSPDGQLILSGSDDGTVRLWDRSGKAIGQPKNHGGWVGSVAFSPDGKTIISGGSDGVRVWQGGTWRDWLAVGCDRLRLHPVFTSPAEDATEQEKIIRQEAIQTCLDYGGWSSQQKAEFFARQKSDQSQKK